MSSFSRRFSSRRRAVAPLAAALALVGTVAATTTPAVAATVMESTTATSTVYSFSKRFTVAYSGNQQGLAYANGIHYVAFDTGGGYGRIVAYDDSGKEVKRTPSLRLGHAAEVSYRVADGNLYVAIYGGGAGLKVGVVDMRPAVPVLVRTHDFSYLGTIGMVAIDNGRDEMVLKSGPKEGPHTFTSTDMQGKIVSQFTDVSQGLGQGLEVVGDDLLLYTSAADFKSNKITAYSRTTGTVRARIHVPVASEGEGLSVDHRTGELNVGFYNHALYRMSPAYVPVLTAQVAATVGTAAETTVVQVSSSADTYGNEGASSTNYGGSSSLASRGSKGLAAYLRFSVPAAPSGATLVAAELRFRTKGDSFAGSPDSQRIGFAGDGWIETGLTWNTRPALSGAAFGSVVASASSTVYRAPLDVSALKSLPGTTRTVAITSSGADSLWFWSRNHANSSYRPTLVLTYS